MAQLTNSAISKLFSLPSSDWETIRKRVTFINQLANQNVSYMGNSSNQGASLEFTPSANPDIILQPQMNDGYFIKNMVQNVNNSFEDLQNLAGSQILGKTYDMGTQLCIIITYWDVVDSPSAFFLFPKHAANLGVDCQDWAQGLSLSLAGLASEISEYAVHAISDFTSINDQLSGADGIVNTSIQSTTQQAIQSLQTSTSILANKARNLTQSLQQFLQDNEQFYSFFQENSFLVPLLNCPMLNPESASNFNNAFGAVLGGWSSLSNDISSIASTCQDITNIDLPFLESLEIESAISLWQTVKVETASFAGSIPGYHG